MQPPPHTEDVAQRPDWWIQLWRFLSCPLRPIPRRRALPVGLLHFCNSDATNPSPVRYSYRMYTKKSSVSCTRGRPISRGLKSLNEELPPNTESQLEMTVFDFAKVARIAVLQTGPDLGDAIAGLESKASAQDVEVFQVWLKLSSPSVGAAVNVLRQNGYFVGGPLPRWFDEDGLLMQKLLCAPDFEAIKLHSKRAESILEAITEDWERTRKC